MSVNAQGIEALRQQLEEAVGSPNVEARTQRLRSLRRELERLAGVADTYLKDAQLERESAKMEQGANVLAVRHNADIREEMLRRGMATPEELDAKGMLSHEALDQLAEEGRLEESVVGLSKAFGLGLLKGQAFNLKVRRGPHGEFEDKPGDAKVKALLNRAGSAIKPGHKEGGRFHVDSPEPLEREHDVTKVLRGRRGGVKGKSFRVKSDGTSDEATVASSQWAQGELDRMRAAAKKEKDPKKKADLSAEADKFESANFESKTVKKKGGGFKQAEHPTKLTDAEKAAEREKATQKRFKETSKEVNTRVNAEVQSASRAGKLKGDVRQQMKSDPGPTGTKLSQAETHFNEAGRVSQRTFLNYVNEAASQPTTTEKFANQDGSYDPTRQALHERIIDGLLRQRNPDGSLNYNGAPLPSQDQPQVIFSGGGYASGKGGMLKILGAQGDLPPQDQTMVLDPDVIKGELPEFRDHGDDAERNLLVYQEAWDIAQEAQRRAQEKHLHMIVDGISNTGADEMAKRIKGFTDQGYVNPRVAYITIPTDESIKRAAYRSENAQEDKDRRMIPDVIMRSVHRDVAATIPALMERSKELGVQIDVFDNNQGKDDNGKFKPPAKIAEATPEGNVNVLDQATFQQALNKANEGITGVDSPQAADAPMPIGEARLRATFEQVFNNTNQDLAPQPFNNQDSIYAAATKAQPEFEKVLDQGAGVASDLGADTLSIKSEGDFNKAKEAVKGDPTKPYVILAATKDPAKAAKKVEGKYDGDWTRIQDVVRGTVLVPSAEQVTQAVQHVTQEAEAAGWQVTGHENKMVDLGTPNSPGPEPSGYRDVALTLTSPDGFKTELQVNTTEMWVAKEETGHVKYDEIRNIRRAAGAEGRPETPEEVARIQELLSSMQQDYSRGWLESLKQTANQAAQAVQPTAQPAAQEAA